MNNTSDNAIWYKRLINYVVDIGCILLVFYIILRTLPYTLKYLPFDFEIDLNIILLVVYSIYFILLESINGRTIGKYFTNTKVIGTNGNKPSFGNILIRTLVRLTTIEALSYLSERPIGWHDSISKTEVVETKKND